MKEDFEIKFYNENIKDIDFLRIKKMSDLLFKEESIIGSGDFSKVYQDDLNDVCYKVLGGFEQICRAGEEANILSKFINLDSKNFARCPRPYFSITPIVKLDEAKSKFARGFFVMEKINGFNLKDIVEKNIALPQFFNAESFFTKIYNTIGFMHGKLIYHRDIHAGNIMVGINTGEPFIIDFGNSIQFNEEDRLKIENKEIDPYKLEVKGSEFNLQEDLVGLEKIKREFVSLTK